MKVIPETISEYLMRNDMRVPDEGHSRNDMRVPDEGHSRNDMRVPDEGHSIRYEST